MRLEGTGEATVLAPMQPEAGAAGRKEGSGTGGDDEAEMQVWRGSL